MTDLDKPASANETLDQTCHRLAEDRSMDISPAVRCVLRMAGDALSGTGEVDWRDMATAPHGLPILAQFHEWNDPDRPLMEQVVWHCEGRWRAYPCTEGTAFADRWRPLPTVPVPAQLSGISEGLKPTKAQLLTLSAIENRDRVSSCSPTVRHRIGMMRVMAERGLVSRNLHGEWSITQKGRDAVNKEPTT